MRKLFWTLGAVAVVALLADVGLYFYAFGPGSGFALSHNAEDWSGFGAYVGGTLGPIYGLLAFGGILITIAVQRQQMERVSTQARLGELMRLIARASRMIDDILNAEPKGITETLRDRLASKHAPTSMLAMLSAIGTGAMFPSIDYLIEARNQSLRAEVVPVVRYEAQLLGIELQRFVNCIEKYRKAGGSAMVIAIYKERYQMIVCWLDVVALLNAPIAERYFTPKIYLEDTRAERNAALASSKTTSTVTD